MKTLKPIIFWVDTGAFMDSFIVSVGKSKKEILSYAKKTKASKDTIKLIEELEDEDLDTSRRIGMTLMEKKSKAVVLLHFPKVDDTWDSWETVMHECHHAVFLLSKKKGFEDEMEAQAYLFEYLFRRIRRTLTLNRKK